MNRSPAICVIWLAMPLAAQPADAGRTTNSETSGRPAAKAETEPPELPDTGVLTLPGRPAAPVAASVPQPRAPGAGPVPAAPAEEDHRPVLRRAPKPILPAEFQSDSALFCQKLIGAWTERDAYNLFGDPLRGRASTEGDGTVTGHINAYTDPTSHYREIELDFARDTGLLRTVFVYPWDLSWRDCRRTWGGNVQSAQANKGRTFYSYRDRRMDVLVDSTGRVISLGLY